MSVDWKEIVAEWQGEKTFIGKNDSGGSVQMGEISGVPGISPMELILAGLAGCSGIDVAMILEKKRQQLSDFKVKVRGKRVDTYPMVYDQIEIEYLFWGKGLSEKSLEQAIQLSEEKYCSVSAMFAKTAQINSSYRVLAPGEEV